MDPQRNPSRDGRTGMSDVERLRRDNAMLTRQLDALTDTDRGELLARVDELTALAKAQAEELHRLNLQVDQARGRGGW